ncbi:MAG: hypothetical protein V3W43_17230 [Desulfatiglandaceae bacterium]
MAQEKISPEAFQEMVKGKSDEELLAGFKGFQEQVLDGTFDSMKNAFHPSKAAGVTAVIQYDIDTPNGLMSYGRGQVRSCLIFNSSSSCSTRFLTFRFLDISFFILCITLLTELYLAILNSLSISSSLSPYSSHDTMPQDIVFSVALTWDLTTIFFHVRQEQI